MEPSPAHPELVTTPGCWRHGHRSHRCELLTRHLLSNYPPLSSEITDQLQDVSSLRGANKATVGQPGRPGLQPGPALNGYNSMFYDPPAARLLEYSRPGMSPIQRNSKSCEHGRHFSDPGSAAGPDWAGDQVMMRSSALIPPFSLLLSQSELVCLYPGSQPRQQTARREQSIAMTFRRREKDGPWLSQSVSCQTSNKLWDSI